MSATLAPESVGRAELVFGLGVALLLVSGLLPWIAATEPIPVSDPAEEAGGLNSFDQDATSEEILGIDRVDWVVVAGVGLVATVLIVTEPWSPVVLAVAGASAAAALGLGVAYVVDPVWMYSDWIKSEVAAVTDVGPGVYLAVGSGLLQCAGCYLGATGAGSSTGAQQLDAPPSANQGSPQSPDAQQSSKRGQPPQQANQQRPGPQQDQPRRRQPERPSGESRSPRGPQETADRPPEQQSGREPPASDRPTEQGHRSGPQPPRREETTDDATDQKSE